jgi:hypothetical protein
MTSGQVLEIENDGTIVDSFDWEGNLNLGVNGGTATLSPTIYFNAASSGTAEQSTIVGSSTGPLLYSAAAASHSFSIAGTIRGALTTTQLLVEGGVLGIYQNTASTALTVQGNAAATGIGVIINSGPTTLTSGGEIASFQSNGTEKANFDYLGNLNIGPSSGSTNASPSIFFNGASSENASIQLLTGSTSLRFEAPSSYSHQWLIGGTGIMQLLTTELSTPPLIAPEQISALTLSGNMSAGAGPGVILDTGGNITSGEAISLRNNGTEIASLDYQGALAVTQLRSNGQKLITATNVTGSAGLSSPVVNATSNDMCGSVSFTGSTNGYSGGLLFTVTFTKPFPNYAYVIVQNASGATATVFGGSLYTQVNFSGPVGAKAISFSVYGTGNTDAEPFSWNWICVGA